MIFIALNDTFQLGCKDNIRKECVTMPTVNASITRDEALNNFVDNFDIINALADRNRQRIIILLFHHMDDGMTVTEITRQMSITQPAVSHHLKILCEANLVSFKKNGLQSFYYLTLEQPLSRLEKVIHDLHQEVAVE